MYEVNSVIKISRAFYYLPETRFWHQNLYLKLDSSIQPADLVGNYVVMEGVVASKISRGLTSDRYKVSITTAEVVKPLPGYRLWTGLAGLIRRFEARIDSYFPWPESALIKGLLFGRRQDLGRWRRVFQITGTSHVVAASGFNVMLVFGAVFYLTALFFSRKAALLAGLVMVWLYAVMISLQPPVVRAAFGASLLVVSQWFKAGRHGWYIFLVGILVLLIVNPWLLISVSFQLSVVAVWGLMYLGSLSLKLVRILPTFLKEDAAASLAAQAAVMPVISLYFGGVSLLGLLVNGLVLWTVPILTFGGILVLVMAEISPDIAEVLAGWLYYSADYFMMITEIFSRIKFGFWYLKLNPVLVVAYYLILIWGSRWLKRRFRL